jgi:16S rRNA (guanine527-N7)-methyltransferase
MENQDRAAFLAAEDVSRETLDRLDRVIDTLDSWRKRSNLIGPREWPVIWTRHVADCFQLLDHLPDDAKSRGPRIWGRISRSDHRGGSAGGPCNHD